MLEYALSFVTEEYERVSMDYGEQGSAMSEGASTRGPGRSSTAASSLDGSNR